MKITLAIIVLALCTSVSPLGAEMYQWVDENGKRHFGDRVPEQYQEGASDISVKPNVVDTVETPKHLLRGAEVAPKKPGRRGSSSAGGRSLIPSPKDVRGTGCEADKERYRLSQACYAMCPKDYVDRPGGGLKPVPSAACKAQCGPGLRRPSC